MARSPKTSLKRGLGYTLVIWAFLFAVVEGGIRLYDRLATPGEGDPEVISDPAAIFEPHPFAAYVANPDNDNHNAQGFRATGDRTYQASPEVINIIAMGGSSTYGTRVHTHEAYPAQLEEILRRSTRSDKRIDVINAGLGGYATPNLISLLTGRIVHLEPRVILFYTGFNDAWTRLMFPGFRTDYSHAQKVWAYPERPWWRYSRTLDLTAELLGAPYVPPHLHSVAWKAPGGDPEDNFAASSGDAFRANLVSLIAIARAHGAIPVFITQATDFPNHPLPDHNEIWQRAMEEHTHILESVAREQKVPLIDVRSAMSDRPEYFMDVLHMNARGNRRRAEIVADYLLKNGLLGEAVQAKDVADLQLIVDYMGLTRADVFVQRALKYRIDELRKSGTEISPKQEQVLLEAFRDPRNIVALYARAYRHLSRKALEDATRFFSSELGRKTIGHYASGEGKPPPRLTAEERRRLQAFQASASWQEIESQRPQINRDVVTISNNLVLAYLKGEFKPPYQAPEAPRR